MIYEIIIKILFEHTILTNDMFEGISMGNYKTCEMTGSGIKVISQIPEPSGEGGRNLQEAKKMLAILLREQMQKSLSEGGGS